MIAKKPCLIVVEGRDSIGKETQTKMLVEHYVRSGKKAVRVELPVQDALTYKLIRWSLKNGLALKLPNLFQFLQFMNKVFFQQKRLKQLLAENDVVVLDRWHVSNWVYGIATGVNARFLDWMCSKLEQPDLTVVIHGPSHKKENLDVYEADKGLQRLVNSLYESWTLQMPDSVLVSSLANSFRDAPDKNCDRDEMHKRILEVLRKHCIMV